ncbi:MULTISPECIES: HEAT repeat domain-containing protein [Massilia]|uniref:HEAT repeat domain-containing protein n=1 Tax=Massilia frigida TaxID=2609281 RepID=A0ABX0NDA2_9BURK|nr:MULTISPECIES: HEAT repeat domain-containing protein [Massilia]MDQ1833208.1 HEAT repeat domain-containing protein [Massilia sp. CCM 9029]NHZ80512.1 hypothetical protein [Massilia frigida]
MSNSNFHFPVIGPLVTRHAEDAAFYWSQLDRAAASPQVGFDKLQHFNRLQDAHLDGLRAAGASGWLPALHALERWRKAGEAFVCTLLAMRPVNRARLDSILTVVRQRPDELLRGLVSALAWMGDQSDEVIQIWSGPKADPVAQVAALRAVAVRGPAAVAHLASPLAAYFSSSTPHVRAAACRAAGVGDKSGIAPLLIAALEDSDLAVRAEAAISLAASGEYENALSVLKACVLLQAGLYASATGWYRMQSARRLHRWTMKLAILTAPGTSSAHDLLALLPARSGLTFAMAHGDLIHLPFVVEHMANPEVDRYAGWIWETLTGMDLAAAGWTIPEPAPSTQDSNQVITQTRLDADNGLARPLHAAVRAYTASSPFFLLHGKRVLCGQELALEHALNLLESASQPVRSLAAHSLDGDGFLVRMNVCAPASAQRSAMNALYHMLAGKVAA